MYMRCQWSLMSTNCLGTNRLRYQYYSSRPIFNIMAYNLPNNCKTEDPMPHCITIVICIVLLV